MFFKKTIFLGLTFALINFSQSTEAETGAPSVPPASPVPKVKDTANDAKKDDPSSTAKADLAAEKFWRALKLLDGKSPAELSEGRALLQAAADMEFTHAQTLLAECLMTGQYGFSKDKRKAANCYRLAAERGNAFAMVSFGQCLYSGTGVRKNRDKATEWLTAAVDEKADYSRPVPPADYLADIAKKPDTNHGVAGELDRDAVGDCKAAAHYLLGLIAIDGKKTDLSQKHFVAAATAGIGGRSGIYLAAVQAALNYAFGQGIPRDMVKANEMLAISRTLTIRAGMRRIHNYTTLKIVDDFAAGDLEEEIGSAGTEFQTQAQYDIATTFTNKKSKDYNPAEAAKWFELAAENDNAWAMLHLAFLYSGNELGRPDPAKAFLWFEKVGGGKKPKHTLGTANYAICLYNGIGTPKDTAKAEALFKEHKDTVFACYLGTKGECPKTVLNWDEWVKLIETWAKDKKDPQAQYFLGKRYLNGWDDKPDPKAAIRWFKKASAAGHGQAWTELGVLHEYQGYLFNENGTECVSSAVNCYKRATEANEPNGMANYANMLDNGNGIKRDCEQAERIYLRCLEIDPDHARAHNNLASIYEDRLGGFENIEKAVLEAVKETKASPKPTTTINLRLKRPRYESLSTDDLVLRDKMLAHYEAAFRLELAYAARNLGRLHRAGLLVEKDYRKAYQYYEKAAEWGLAEDHFVLGELHELGQGVPVTYTEAAYHYRLAALEGDKRSLKKLIDLYLSGKLGEIDLDRAKFWLDRMIAQGDFSGLTTNIDVLLQKKEYATAIEWLRFLEEYGGKGEIGFACERLSRCYEQGLGVKASPSKAKKYLERALANNDSDALAWQGMLLMKEGKHKEGIAAFEKASSYSSNACFYLGQLYYHGTYVEKDQARALQLMRRAASSNHSEALYFLAGATYKNIAGAPNLEEAISMATQAEVCGLEKAKALREKLEKRRDAKNGETVEEAAGARSS
ncbi:MAG: tetratricopeptide repeat protein [Nibricoccus sp.]